MSLQVPFVVRFHIRLFQIIGCFDASLCTKTALQKREERRLVGWTNLLSLTFCLTTINTFFRPDAFLFTSNRFGYFNDVLKVCIAQVTVFIIYIETVLRREPLRKFWQKYATLNHNEGGSEKSQMDHRTTNWRLHLQTHRRFLYMFYCITLFDLLIEAIFLFFGQPTRHILQFWIMFTPYIYIVHLRNMEIVFHIEIIRHELEKLRGDISLLAEYTRFANRVVPFVGFESFVRCKLAEKQLIFQHAYEMFDYFQQAFGLSTVAVLLMIYVRVVVDAYFMFYNEAIGPESLENLLMLPAYLEIPALLLTSQKCMNVVKFIAFELHNIKGSVENSVISVQIQNFSLQMLHQKIRIDGLGISPLDGKMLISIVGSITTYMVFFIQFMPKFRNL